MMARLEAAAERHKARPAGDQETVGFFQEFVPWPAEYDPHWCYQNWGTPREAFNLDGCEGSFFFDTAWTPPIKFYDKMTSLGFEVEWDCNDNEEIFGDEEEEEQGEPKPRQVKYMGREAAHQAYLAVAAAELVCLICHTTKGEIEERLGAAPTPEEAAKKELIIKTTFVVPRCGASVPHLLHRSCLKSWLKKPENNKCPTCRADITNEVSPTSMPESQVSSLDSQAAGGGGTQ